jgi:formylmethanofuran dehydrogenase subunit E
MIRTDDPLADFSRHEAEQWEELQKMPVCSECEEHIQEDRAYHIEDKWICTDCINNFLEYL